MADGSIRIQTRIDNKQAERDLHKLSDVADQVGEKIKQAFDTVSPKRMYDSMQQQKQVFEETTQQVKELNQELQNLDNQSIEIDKKIAELETKRAEMEQSVRDALSEKYNKGYNRISEGYLTKLTNIELAGNDQYQQILDQIVQMQTEVVELDNQWLSVNETLTQTEALMNEASQGAGLIKTVMGESYHWFSPLIEGTQTWIGWLKQAAGKASELLGHFKKIGPNMKDASSSSSDFGKAMEGAVSRTLKTVKRLGLGILGIRSAFSAVRKAVNLVLADNEGLKNQMDAIWQGIANIIAPVVEYVISGIGKIMSMVNALFKVFTGKDLFKAVNKAAKSTGTMAKNAKATADSMEEAKNQAAAFDKMNILSDNSKSGSGGGDSDGASIPSLFDVDEARIDSIKAKLDELLEPLLKAWDKYGKGFTDSFKRALQEIWQLVKDIGKSFEIVWTNGTGQKTIELILQIFTDIFNTIGNIAHALDEAWIKNDIGTEIIQHLWNGFNNLLQIIKDVTGAIEEFTRSLDFTPVMNGINEVSKLFETLTSTAEQTTRDVIDKIKNGDWKGAGETVTNGINSSLETLRTAIDQIDFKKIGQYIGDMTEAVVDFFSGIDWMAIAEELVSDSITLFRSLLDGFTEWVRKVDWYVVIADLIKFLGAAIVACVGILGEFLIDLVLAAFQLVFDIIGDIGKHIIDGLIDGMSSIGKKVKEVFEKMVKAVKDFLGIHSPSKLFKEIGQFIVDGLILAIKLIPEKVVQFFKNMYQGIKNTLSTIGEWFSSIFKDAYNKVTGAFSGFVGFFTGLWDKIKSVFSTLGTSIASAISSSVKAGLNGLISMIENTINSAIGLINGAIDLVNKIPGVKVGKVNRMSLPRLERGAIVNHATRAIVGENGREAVLPLQNNTQWMDELADRINDHNGGNNGDGQPILLTVKIGDYTLAKKLIKIQKELEFIAG